MGLGWATFRLLSWRFWSPGHLPLNGGPRLDVLLVERRLGPVPDHPNLSTPIEGPCPAPATCYAFPLHAPVVVPGLPAPSVIPPGPWGASGSGSCRSLGQSWGSSELLLRWSTLG